jgi:hypothetical protein
MFSGSAFNCAFLGIIPGSLKGIKGYAHFSALSYAHRFDTCVIIEPSSDGGGFTAHLATPFQLTASAATAEETHATR